jgi:hypothetical protein
MLEEHEYLTSQKYKDVAKKYIYIPEYGAF